MPDLSDTIEDRAEEGVESHTADGETTTATSIPDLIAADKYLASKSALDGSNSNGGPRSMWGRTRTARAIPQGFGT